MILLDVTHTSHTSSQSGIQQVTRNLFAALSTIENVQPIVYDPYAKRFRPTDPSENALLNLSQDAKPNSSKRGSRWSTSQKLQGYLHRLLSLKTNFSNHPISAIIVPEIIPKKTPTSAYLELRALTNAPLKAVFHDAIALKFPHLTPHNTVQYFPAYLEKLSHFDTIAAVSQSSQNDLDQYWKNNSLHKAPHTTTISLGTHKPTPPRHSDPQQENSPMILFVGSIEGRKNHFAALKALESLWNQGLNFSLELIGGSVPETGKDAIDLLEKLLLKGRPIIAHGPTSDEHVNDCYARCAFTLYPSLWEGFGMPVIESLIRGKPSVCSDRGGLAETIVGGGCLVPQSLDPDGIADAVKSLLHDNTKLQRLSQESQQRTFQTWQEYATSMRNC